MNKIWSVILGSLVMVLAERRFLSRKLKECTRGVLYSRTEGST